jgi:excinuclease ABC subunit C
MENINFNIQEELKKLPNQPGVYLMRDKKDQVIYVGKAISLKNRVRQYFQGSRNQGIKIERMVTQIASFEVITTDTELEALVLESNLIKEYRPRYNTMLTDDKGYPFIKITADEDYPRLMLARKMIRDKGKYFGPYKSAVAVREIIDLMGKLYQIRSCNRRLPRDIGKERPCLNHHIHQCDAPCQGLVSKEDYNKSIQEVIRFLNGNYKDAIKELEEKMNVASSKLLYERAIEYRELIENVKLIAQEQKVVDLSGEDRDVLALAMKEEDAVVQVFFIRGGKMIGQEHFYMKVSPGDGPGDVMGSFIKQYYGGTPFVPCELFLQVAVPEQAILEQWLGEKRGGKVTIKVPLKGVKEKLVEMAANNAELILTNDMERLKREEKKTLGAIKEIEKWLDIEGINRIEAFDISNTAGFQSVGSMVVYEKGKPKRNDYRKFKIKGIQGIDDYGSLKEVLNRRFARGLRELEEGGKEGGFNLFPDLILMDGGKGQVNIALDILEEMKINIPVCGMVKDEKHRTRGLYYDNEEIEIDKRSEGFKLIARIQEEAHRFAITYHRSLRGKSQVNSILDEIPGIGEVRRKALMRHFSNIDEMKNASMDEFLKVPGMNRKSAESVVDFFQKRNKKKSES